MAASMLARWRTADRVRLPTQDECDILTKVMLRSSDCLPQVMTTAEASEICDDDSDVLL